MDPKTLAKQRAQLKENLGLTSTLGTDDFVDESDLMAVDSATTQAPR